MQKPLDFGPAKVAAADANRSALDALFHPAVADWFADSFKAPTEVQRRAWQATAKHEPALIAAPTGSGKTLAAFLAAINDLVTEGLEKGLDEAVYVLYVSPLKALSNDIQKNLQAPLEGIRERLVQGGYGDVLIRDAVRTGDTTTTERAAMRRSPPHILVTTPESLFILL
ncbi:MAG: DEAD/DEAH box helicase, partial [Nevskiales bacterium]